VRDLKHYSAGFQVALAKKFSLTHTIYPNCGKLFIPLGGNTDALATTAYFPTRLIGVSLVGFLTYTGEYISYLVILASIQDKLVSQFQFGLYGTFVVGVIAGAYLVVSGLLAVPLGHWTDKYGRRIFATVG
jgi:MFS family permease